MGQLYKLLLVSIATAVFLHPSEIFAQCERIISTAPSITATLKLLGLADQIVGVTRFCDRSELPPQNEVIGGFDALNLERIVRLEPTMTFLLSESIKDLQRLRSLGIDVTILKQGSPSEVIESYYEIGRVCKVDSLARDIAIKSHDALKATKDRSQERRKIRVAFIVGLPDQSEFSTMYISGHDSIYYELANGLNTEVISHLVTTPLLNFPLEGFLGAFPEIIIHINPESSDYPSLKRKLFKMWQGLIPKIKEEQIVVLEDSSAWNGGPSFLELNDTLEGIFRGFR